jgi:ArsR family transcriptional regulator, arsenate/arsenite/antimonite-responsive transcriptional repressor
MIDLEPAESPSLARLADDQLAAGLLSLAHPVRLAIVRHLAASDACCNKDVVARVGLAQSTVSQHLKVLVDIGIVTYAPDRQRSRYSLNKERLSSIADAFGTFRSTACADVQAGSQTHKDWNY